MSDEIRVQEVATVALGMFRRLSARGQTLGYDRDSLSWVEDYLESNREKFSELEFTTLTQLVGAYLGECVRQTYGGSWNQREGAWGIFFDSKTAAFPFAKAQKFMENGLAGGDTITGFFDIVPLILNKSL
jgi:hypothetical protein